MEGVEHKLLQHAYEEAVKLADQLFDVDPCSMTMSDLFISLNKLGYSWNGKKWKRAHWAVRGLTC